MAVSLLEKQGTKKVNIFFVKKKAKQTQRLNMTWQVKEFRLLENQISGLEHLGMEEAEELNEDEGTKMVHLNYEFDKLMKEEGIKKMKNKYVEAPN